ncbi:hypothetical protein HPB50_012627 [Hyalomma asiaticum]|uniref:Uncharacterized protein n=1 Tax=Hyalomma asiaticum TaxID=266040 RepID=A0ACB7SB03_HYAAI|nr:hypothetical protein HPB50_012627 [Hyalomma asiaticum]
MAAWPLGYHVCGLLLVSCHFTAVRTVRLEETGSLVDYRQFCSSYRCCPQETDRVNMDCSARNASQLQQVSVPAPISSLSLRHNRISQLQRGSFAMAPTLSRLDLSHNNIAAISEGWWTSDGGNRGNATSGLRSLSLADNAVQDVNRSSFYGLSMLVALDLSYNRIRVLRGDSFAGLTNLEELVVDHNPIVSVRGDTLAPLVRLRELQMNYLARLVVSPHAFRFVPTLKILGMAGNNLKSVPQRSLQTLKLLRSLDLSWNPLTTITESGLQGLPRLSVLRLNDLHELTKVEAHAFGSLPGLKELHLSYNPMLMEVDPDAFYNKHDKRWVHLNALHLRRTGLRSLPSKLQDWNQLAVVDLSENAWRCDCRLSWMAKLAERLPAEHRPRCAAPLSVEGRPVGDLRPYEFSCEDSGSPGLASSIGMVCAMIASAAVAFVGVRIYECATRTDERRYTRFTNNTCSQ